MARLQHWRLAWQESLLRDIRLLWTLFHYLRLFAGLKIRIRVRDCCQVSCARTRVQLFQQPVIALTSLQLHDLAVGIVHIAKDDRSRRACLLARRQNCAILRTRPTSLSFRLNTRTCDSLDTVGALLHHTSAAYRDLGIAHELQLHRVPILIEQEVEAAYLLRAV